TAPTLLVQGEQDALFGLDQADANARQIAAAGSTVKVAWYAGGHDGAPPGAAVYAKVSAWFEHYLAGRGPTPPDTFSYALSGPVGRRGAETRTTVAPAYPGLRDSAVTRNPVSLHGSAQLITNPPGGSPAAISALPGIGSGLGALASKLAIDVPGEFATFDGPRLAHPGLITGASTVRLRISAVGTAPAHGAVLFAKLYDVSAQGKRSLPGSSVAPLRVSGLGTGGSKTVSVSLPGIVTSVPAGHHLELVVSTTDAAYANSSSPASYRIALAGDRALRVPVVTGHTANGSIPIGQLIAIGALLALALSAAVVLWWSGLYRRRRPGGDQADIPLEFHGVSKVYGRDRIVVRDLSFTVQRGQVVGLLGPNGAGKTTALRIALGLVQPASGQVRVFGHEVTPGAPVLSRVGAFVEQSGFLPHLSGAQNLRLYWAATGRPESESRMAQALDIADLDTAVDRKVGTYSQGMRQRLAIAQAMLGLPELLILDEPTNGLDPPQIRDMRAVLRRYASEGRTVLVSSHLLAEVEQTCDHVVVMHNGRLVATGAVDEVVAAGGETSFEVDRPSQAAALLDAVDGVSIVSTEGSTVHAELNGTPAAVAVASLVGADIAVRRVGPRRRLEDAFLALIGDSPEGSGQRQDSETSETSEAGSGR
ncbi:MAG: ATP-binding cassette domain-containing protein, partial [Sciscionella sp.]